MTQEYRRVKKFIPEDSVLKMGVVKNHPYHLVQPSVIPIMLSFFTGLFTISLIQFLHDVYAWSIIGLKLGSVLLILCVFYWFRCMRRESLQLNVYTAAVEENLLNGVMLFIISEALLFFSVFWAFFHSSVSPSIFVGHIWPPVGIEAISPWRVPLLNTLLLLASGVTVNSFYYTLKGLSNIHVIGVGFHGKSTKKTIDACFHFGNIVLSQSFYTSSKRLLTRRIKRRILKSPIQLNCQIRWERLLLQLELTLILGILFLMVQFFEYVHAPFAFSDGIYGSVFYMATGLHGLHVLLGWIMLSCVCGFFINGYMAQKLRLHLSSTGAVWYWHFVDVVWLILFVFVYVWGNLI